MQKNIPSVLYFINRTVPTEADLKKASELSKDFDFGLNVKFRRGDFVSQNEAIEKSDFVAGDIPEPYKSVPVLGKKKQGRPKKEIPETKGTEAWKPN